MAEATRGSVLAIIEESTEGTFAAVSGATDFIPLREGFTVEPNFETVANDEIKNSIGASKPVQGLESPTASIPFYLHHSGVEGQAPVFGRLLKNCFGSVNSNATERTTTTGSTTTIVELGAGGTDFARGRAVLLKDEVNGRSIRPVHSVSSNSLTLGFALANAPATGVNCGKAVTYEPANNSHPSHTIHLFRGNIADIEAVAGARVTSLSLSATAGEPVEGNFELEGIKYFFNPITLAATDTKLDFTDQDGTFAATIPAGTYRDPHMLAQEIEIAMAAVSARTPTVTYSDSTGKFTISITGITLSLLFSTGGNAANSIHDKLGFTTADKTGATTYTSENAQSWAASVTPSFDTADMLVAKNMEVLLGDGTESACYNLQSFSFTMNTPKTNVLKICAESGIGGSVIASREVTLEAVATYTKHDVDLFKRFRSNSNVRFCFNFGEKDDAADWIEGKAGSLYLPSNIIEAFSQTDTDGLVTTAFTLRAYVDNSGNDEVYLNFL